MISSLISGLAHAMVVGLVAAAQWALNGAIKVMLSTTSVHLSAMAGPWRAMLTIAGFAALPVILIATAQAAVQGRPAEIAKRGIVIPAVVAIGTLSAQGLLSGLLAFCSWASWVLIDVGLGGSHVLVTTWAKFAVVLAGTSRLAGPQAPVAVVAILAITTALVGLTIWIELALRAALLYLLVGMVPLVLVGLYWQRLSHWVTRLGEVILAIALSQVVITAAMVIGTSVLNTSLSNHSFTAPLPGLAEGVSGLALLMLGSFALPMTLRLVPMAVDAASHAGVGQRVARHASALAQGAASSNPSGLGAAHRIATAPFRAASGYKLASQGAGTGGPSGTSGFDGPSPTSGAGPSRAPRPSSGPGSTSANIPRSESAQHSNSVSARFGARAATWHKDSPSQDKGAQAS